MEDQWAQMFKENRILDVIAAAPSRLRDLGKPLDDSTEKQIDYFDHHSKRMLYLPDYKQRLFYGSGVVEAGCKAVIGQRLKQSGMFWSESRAQRVLALRCILMRNRWDNFWDRLNNSDYLPNQSAV